ncbi:MAG: PD40 domain-containing protein [Chitinispirillaceae bacterium]|nr:PD40 domain-containing protein [Chitinispirillaceae bacterium]
MHKALFFIGTLLLFTALAQEAPLGSMTTPKGNERKALDALRGRVAGKIVWATSRANSKHDIWVMNADGTGQTPLTNSPNNVDWYPRFSPDGSRILFVRSKSGWVPETDAEMYEKWDLLTVAIDGSGETKAASDAVWGTWRPSGDSIVFARGPKVVIKSMATGSEKELFDAEKTFNKKGAAAQQPELSPDGRLLAMTLRGTMRETGIWNLGKKAWHSTGGGCEMGWFPSGSKVYRMNEGQGNGGTEVLQIEIDRDGKPLSRISGLSIPKQLRLMDLPGRRSHEYFPKFDKEGKHMVWCATQYGHEHDIADYEVYLWKIGADKKKAFRLTFHTANDRWPDILIDTPPLPPKKNAPQPPAIPNGASSVSE